MCYHKSLVASYEDLASEYSASFSSITEELEVYREQFDQLMSRNESIDPYTKEETLKLKALQKTLQSFKDEGYVRYHENGFDYLPSPIITAAAPSEFKLLRWGSFAPAAGFTTLNCISEEMYDKKTYKEAVENGQRCLIPVTGFYEWNWVDEKGKTKIPYYISVKDQPISSMAGLYIRWKDKSTKQDLFWYTVLTTKANPMMEQIHNSKKRMPVIIPEAYKKDWLNPNLTKDDVLALCQPFPNDQMQAHTISKLITQKGVDTNVVDVLKVQKYEKLNTDDLTLF